jgi:hypothetical protein
MKNLNKKEPYGTVVGCDQGRAFEQGGVFFNGDGTEWQPPVDGDPDADGHAPLKPRKQPTVKPAAAPKAGKVSAVKSPVDDQLANQ